jgi:hypothetical protein
MGGLALFARQVGRRQDGLVQAMCALATAEDQNRERIRRQAQAFACGSRIARPDLGPDRIAGDVRAAARENRAVSANDTATALAVLPSVRLANTRAEIKASRSSQEGCKAI